MAYTPELSQNDSATLRRLAWASGTPMTTTLHDALAYVASRVTSRVVCQQCRDKSKCDSCFFSQAGKS